MRFGSISHLFIVKYVSAAPMLKVKQPPNMATLGPMSRMRNPEMGMMVPWVIPHTDCTTMKSP